MNKTNKDHRRGLALHFERQASHQVEVSSSSKHPWRAAWAPIEALAFKIFPVDISKLDHGQYVAHLLAFNTGT